MPIVLDFSYYLTIRVDCLLFKKKQALFFRRKLLIHTVQKESDSISYSQSYISRISEARMFFYSLQFDNKGNTRNVKPPVKSDSYVLSYTLCNGSYAAHGQYDRLKYRCIVELVRFEHTVRNVVNSQLMIAMLLNVVQQLR